jgi:hypothetical protein
MNTMDGFELTRRSDGLTPSVAKKIELRLEELRQNSFSRSDLEHLRRELEGVRNTIKYYEGSLRESYLRLEVLTRAIERLERQV